MLIRVVNLLKVNIDSSEMTSVALKVLPEKEGDLDDSDSVLIILTALIKGGIDKIAVDMSNFKIIDSRSIGTLISAAKMIRDHHGNMVLFSVPDQIGEILKPVNMHRYMNMFATESEAFEYLGTL